MEYPYGKENRLQRPHPYTYTLYQGPELVRAYVDDRLRLRTFLRGVLNQEGPRDWPGEFSALAQSGVRFWEALPAPDHDVKAPLAASGTPGAGRLWLNQAPAEAGSANGWLKDLGHHPGPIPTRKMLGDLLLLAMLSSDREVEGLSGVAERLLKKYEVFKRIYSAYDSHWRKTGEDCRDLLVYLLTSAVCGVLYHRAGSLHHLNAQLKLNDLASSERASLTALPLLWLADFSIALELRAVLNL